MDPKGGCSLASFDASSNLLATRLDDSPSTVWIWDLAATELRAVLIFHSTAEFSWHPHARELLLVNCQDEVLHSVPFVWDPLSNGPSYLALEERFPGQKASGKLRVTWINWEQDSPALFVSDTQRYCLLSLADAEEAPDQWQSEGVSQMAPDSARARVGTAHDGEDYPHIAEADDTSLLEDTFSFKHG